MLYFTLILQKIAETLDSEIKSWAAGKEGNMRALLSSLHYVISIYYIFCSFKLCCLVLYKK